MIIGVYWCERHKLWVRFSKEDGAVTAEVAELSPDDPSLTTEWQAVNQGAWLVNYKLGSSDPINEFYRFKDGTLELIGDNGVAENTKLTPYEALPLTPELWAAEEPNEKRVEPFTKSSWSFGVEVEAADEIEQEEDYQLKI